jgi:hypothetical protein
LQRGGLHQQFRIKGISGDTKKSNFNPGKALSVQYAAGYSGDFQDLGIFEFIPHFRHSGTNS